MTLFRRSLVTAGLLAASGLSAKAESAFPTGTIRFVAPLTTVPEPGAGSELAGSPTAKRLRRRPLDAVLAGPVDLAKVTEKGAVAGRVKQLRPMPLLNWLDRTCRG